jgi:hypothetical protein
VHEQVGVHAAAELPVAAPLGVLGAVERHLGGEAELRAEEHLPVHGLGVHVLGEGIIPPLPHLAVAVIACLPLQDVADLAIGDHGVGHLPARVGGGLDAHGHDPLVAIDGLRHAAGLVDGMSHRLLAVDVLLSLAGVDRLPRVPVVGGGDHHCVDVFAVEQAAIVLGDDVLVVLLQAALLGRRVEAAADLLVAVPDVGDADNVDGLAFLLLHVEEHFQMLLAAPAGADDAEPDGLIRPLDVADGRMGEGRGGGHGRAGGPEEPAAGHAFLVGHEW